MRNPRPLLAFLLLGAFYGRVAGHSTGTGGNTQAPGGDSAFAPTTAQTFVPKVKNLLTGLPATDDDVAQVTKDATALRGLVSAWMQTPQYQTRMIEFFGTAFQQDNVTADAIQNTATHASCKTCAKALGVPPCKSSTQTSPLRTR